MNQERDYPSRSVAEQIHFVTGRLAEHSLREVLNELAPQAGFQYTMQVLPITVAALMTTEWVASRIDVPPETQRVVLPGYCGGELAVVQQAALGKTVERGPRDLRRLPEFFGASKPRDTSTQPPAWMGVRPAANRPATWKSGMSHRNTLVRPTSLPRMKFRQPKKPLASVRMTPLGRPLVPDV